MALLQPSQPGGQSLGQRPSTYPLAGINFAFGGSNEVPNEVYPTGYLDDASRLFNLMKMMKAKSMQPGVPQ